MARLEEILEKRETYRNLRGIAIGLIRSTQDPDAPESGTFKMPLGLYIHSLDPAVAEDFYLHQPLDVVVDDAKFWLGETKKEFVQDVKDNYEEVLDYVKDENILGKVIPNITPYDNSLDPEHNKLAKQDILLRKNRKAVEDQDLGAYLDLITHKKVKARMTMLAQRGDSAPGMLNSFGQYVHNKEVEFVKEFYDEDDEKVEGVKLRAYVRENVASAKRAGNEQDEIQAYLVTGEALDD